VYVEKPISHNVWEGRQARQRGAQIQADRPGRPPNPAPARRLRDAVAWVRAGNLGKIQISRGLCYKPRKSIGKTKAPNLFPPMSITILWCAARPQGPAPSQESALRLSTGSGHTGNGDLGNPGIHQVDIARWFLGVDGLSTRRLQQSMAGWAMNDDGETPNTSLSSTTIRTRR